MIINKIVASSWYLSSFLLQSDDAAGFSLNTVIWSIVCD